MVTKEQIVTAKKVDLRCFLQDNFPDTIKYDYKTKSYRNATHDSLVINKHAWYQFSACRGGDTIEYLIQMLDMSFIDAVMLLYTYDCGCQRPANTTSDIADQIMPFKMPQKASEINSLFRYMFDRQIRPDTVQKLIDDNLIYEDTHANIVFVRNTCDKRMCIIKGTDPKYPFNKIITEIPHNYWFFCAGENPTKIYVCESPIDAISLYECLNHAGGIYTAMAGLKYMTLKRILNDFNKNNDKEVYIAVDWDKAGQDFCKKYNLDKEFNILLPENNFEKTKDWNEILSFQIA